MKIWKKIKLITYQLQMFVIYEANVYKFFGLQIIPLRYFEFWKSFISNCECKNEHVISRE